MCFVRNVQALRTKHIDLERPAGPRLRHVTFAHIAQGEVARCERGTNHLLTGSCGAATPACRVGEQFPR